jgi:hypothetical protein
VPVHRRKGLGPSSRYLARALRLEAASTFDGAIALPGIGLRFTALVTVPAIVAAMTASAVIATNGGVNISKGS